MDSIKDDALARFDEDNENICIRQNGRSRTTNSLDHLREVFGISKLSDNHKLVLRYLDLLKYHHRLTIKEYRRLTGQKNLNILNDLQFRNWISFSNTEDGEDKEIKVHQLIYDLVEKDDKPTYQNVPGIVSYIDNCFNDLDEMIHEDTAEGESSVDFEKAKCITFALLMYDDIKRTEDEDSIAKKFALLYAFMSVAFLSDPTKTYTLFFESPEESDWYFHVDGIMDWYYFFPSKLDASISATDAFVQGQIGIIVTYAVMSYYFHQKNGDFDLAKKAIADIITEEARDEDAAKNPNSYLNKADCLLFKLKWYLSICRCTQKDTGFIHKIEDTIAVSVEENYNFYRMVFNLLKKTMRSGISEQEIQDCLKEAEGILILLEQSNERFASFGLKTEDVLSYSPPTSQEREENIARHWSKKAEDWYKSVDNTLAKVSNPFEAYSWLLSYNYQNQFLNNSKIQKLMTENLVDRIYNDSRLTQEHKVRLLIELVLIEAKKLKVKRNIKKTPTVFKKILPKAKLYYQAISKIDQLMPNWKVEQVNRQVEIVDVSLDLRKVLDKEFFDINNHIQSLCLSVHNIDYIGKILYLADKLRVYGWIQKAKEIKSQILDLTLEGLALSSDTLSGHTLQMILYKVRPLAIKYNRNDVVSEINKIEMTLARKYSLNLIDPLYDVVSIKGEEQDTLARKFMDDYIDMVALEAYESLHGIVNTNKKIIDEMEHLLVQNLDELLRATDEQNSWYRNIFEDPCIRSLNPFWVSEFHGSSNPKINTGVCYLIAQTYETIPFKTGFGVALEDLIDADGEYDYRLSKDEIQTVLNNIVTICPKAKKEIDAYLKKYPLK